MPQGAVKQLLANPRVFSGTVKGVGGIWQRPIRGKRRDGTYGTKGKQKGLMLLVRYTRQAEEHPIFGFAQRVTAIVQRELPAAVQASIAKGIATARKP